MLNELGKRKNEMEISINQKLFEAEKRMEEMKKEMQELTSKLSKTSEDLQEEKNAHARTKEIFEEADKTAEMNRSLLEKEIQAKDLKIEELLRQLRASEAKSDELSAALCLSQMRSSQVDSQEKLFEDTMEVCKKMDEMVSNLGSKAKKMSFAEGDTYEAVKWCSSTMDVLPKIVRAFGGFSCMAGSQCLAASLERNQCSHIRSVFQEISSCSSKDLKDASPTVDNIGKQIFSLCWEKGWVEDVVRDLIVTLRLQVNVLKSYSLQSSNIYCSKLIFLPLFRPKQSGGKSVRMKHLLWLLQRNQRLLRRGIYEPPCQSFWIFQQSANSFP